MPMKYVMKRDRAKLKERAVQSPSPKAPRVETAYTIVSSETGHLSRGIT